MLDRNDSAGIGTTGASSNLTTLRPLLVNRCSERLLPGGSLAVNDGDKVVPVINKDRPEFCQCGDNAGLAHRRTRFLRSVHPGKKPFETIELPYGTQILWRTTACREAIAPRLQRICPFARRLIIARASTGDDKLFRLHRGDGKTTHRACRYLRARGMKRLFVAGPPTDFCVAWTALRRAQGRFETYVVEDACRGIDSRSLRQALGRHGQGRRQADSVGRHRRLD